DPMHGQMRSPLPSGLGSGSLLARAVEPPLYSRPMAKVLIIESDAAVARALESSLADIGFEAHVTADGTEGLNLARTLAPQVIVLCVELSRVSGYSVCNKLK